ncbi:hypothetical protein SLS61_003773 [Didymella pomorum]
MLPAQARIKTAFPPQSGILGLNDGAIFPKSHFAPNASLKKVAAAALEREPLRNAIRIFVVVVDFQDVKCPPGTVERHLDLWFSKGRISTGSVTEYYSEVSNNAVSLTGDVLGPFTLKEKMAHYANNRCKSNQKWVETVVEDTNHSVTLRDVKAGFKVHRLWKDGDAQSPEYFLVENRQMTGSDEFLPGKGLLIWHIDDRVGSNADENHPWVKLMQADGLDQLKQNFARGDDGDSYPGHTDNRKFSALSNPNSKSYGGEDTFVSVTDIPLSSSTMTFDITVKEGDQPPTDKFDPKMWYRLKNTFQPATHCLDVVNDNGTSSKGFINMAATGNFSGQHWQLKPNGDGTYFLRTLFLGSDKQLGVQSDKKTPILQPANSSAKGQYWTIGQWDHPQDGTWHLEVKHRG